MQEVERWGGSRFLSQQEHSQPLAQRILHHTAQGGFPSLAEYHCTVKSTLDWGTNIFVVHYRNSTQSFKRELHKLAQRVSVSPPTSGKSCVTELLTGELKLRWTHPFCEYRLRQDEPPMKLTTHKKQTNQYLLKCCTCEVTTASIS